ncbi:CoA-substrate-specific enzyme activase, putative [Desulfitobacterium dichloroeliminans LMG P-21439]|uniref:CoA-substrate-specific enzyme activase, putative n=1 Tax=Desulfitobacterium dichloroeliminans (strain LMG P-21439 / DCA1) TaxID=871963 RepID=L0F7I7_DESDL|nr:acyl-CoA dehydratase activase [Desulfitobacterium dichloroeliminans]AGA69804.1 CoA-substrate-specific enzyme activase, putative [Desulfitobacterium dichloroeliminans LMG P-21439]
MPVDKYFLGVDVGSVSTNIVLLNPDGTIAESMYLRTQGRPMQTIQEGMKDLRAHIGSTAEIIGVGTTGSARQLAATLLGADVVKNEITAHAVAASRIQPKVQTILEIGGQDSKIILLRNGVVVDFAMNTVCAAGTGSFLDQQASRLGIPIQEFGPLALQAQHPVRIAGRCSVFAESDMIHKQQLGHPLPDILAGLCQAMIRNYLNNVGKNKEILGPIFFQGGVAANPGIRKAFEEELGQEVTVPEHFSVMGALGAAYLAQERFLAKKGLTTNFRGLKMAESNFKARSFDCKGCSNHCEVVEIRQEDKILTRWGDRCGKWSCGDWSSQVESMPMNPLATGSHK